jgi:predicted DNA-binding transcriptional regulator YafY
MENLRMRRHPVSGSVLAVEVGVSLRSLYRDIASLRAQGVSIAGEPGIGYLLLPGFTLPPLQFTEEELDALVLGSRWAQTRGDVGLAKAAGQALAKIASVLPPERRIEVETSGLRVGPMRPLILDKVDLRAVRQAIRTERRMEIRYVDLKQKESVRIVWPIAIGYFEQVRVLAAWCETRMALRHFRIDRIHEATVLQQRYPTRRSELLARWKRQHLRETNQGR